MHKLLLLLVIFSGGLYAAQSVITIDNFGAKAKYGQALAKTKAIKLTEKGIYRISAKVRSDAGAFSQAQVEAFKGTLLAQSSRQYLTQQNKTISIVWRKTTEATEQFVLKLVSYTAGNNVYWSDIVVEKDDKAQVEALIFDLWVGFKTGTTPSDSALERYKQATVPQPSSEQLPPSPTMADAIRIIRPTLKSIGFVWPINGDYNRNGKVSVRYRKVGTTEWQQGQNMLRMMYEKAGYSRISWYYICPNQYSGSITGLEPDTSYEVNLILEDPDGGNEQRSIITKTRAPLKQSTGNTINVTPGNLKQAYESAQPGDTLLLGEGRYTFSSKFTQERYGEKTKYIFPPVKAEDSHIYDRPTTALTDCALIFNKQATIDKPVTIRGTDKAKVILDGGTSAILINFTDAKYHRFENMTLENCEYAFYSNNATGISINDCIMRNCRYGIVAGSADPARIYYQSDDNDNRIYDFDISNNLLTGNWAADKWTDGWSTYCTTIGYEKMRMGGGIILGGQGHAVFNNRISGFWDGFAVYFIVQPQSDPLKHNAGIDVYNNHISSSPDDSIETDFGVNNIRVFNNLFTNSHMGISCQPVFGGPAYIFKNVVFNTRIFAFKFSRNPTGLQIYNNTCLVARGGRIAPEWQNSQIINNLFLGSKDIETGSLWTGNPTPKTSVIDNNGYSDTGSGKVLMCWPVAAAPSMAASYNIFNSINEYSQATGTTNLQGITSSEFVNYIAPKLEFMSDNGLDLRPKDGASFVNSGRVLHNINDNFSGNAPALGAYDLGEPLIKYGLKDE